MEIAQIEYPATGKVLIPKPQAAKVQSVERRTHNPHTTLTEEHRDAHRRAQRNTDGENGGIFAPIYRYK